MKRLVRLRNKKTKEIQTFPTIMHLLRSKGSDYLGIEKQSLYNALSKGKGKWENEKFAIYYEEINLGNTEWK